MKPRFSDAYRYPTGYADAEQSRKPGYLAGKFAAIRAEQEQARAATQQKVASISVRTKSSPK